MTALRRLQQDFADYLTTGSTAVIDKVVAQGNVDRSIRLQIYQNAYNVRLRNCIETDHPMLGLYLGDDLFELMVTGYIRQYPSHYPSLRHFANRLPEYLQVNEPFRSHPVIAEIASFERRLMDAFDAPDAATATTVELQQLPAQQWPRMRLGFHPSLQLFTTDWNSVECWQALKNESTPPGPHQQQACWFIWRDRERLTQYRNLSTDALVLYNCFKDDYTLADACELLKEHLPQEHIGPATVDHLLSWFELGIIGSIND